MLFQHRVPFPTKIRSSGPLKTWLISMLLLFEALQVWANLWCVLCCWETWCGSTACSAFSTPAEMCLEQNVDAWQPHCKIMFPLCRRWNTTLGQIQISEYWSSDICAVDETHLRGLTHLTQVSAQPHVIWLRSCYCSCTLHAHGAWAKRLTIPKNAQCMRKGALVKGRQHKWKRNHVHGMS